LLATLLGASLTFGYAPWSLWFFVPFALAAFLILLQHSRTSGKRLGFFFGLGWFGAGISWVHVSIEQFGGFPLVGSIALMTLLCAYLALYPAMAFALLKRYIAAPHWWYTLPAIWFVTEWLRSWVLTGFPWLGLGYTQTQGPLALWAPIIGETGLSMLLVMSAALLAHFAVQKRGLNAGLVALLLIGSGLLVKQINWTQPTDTHYNIAMVQGNIKQELRWVPEQDVPTMRKYLELTEPLWNSDIIIWPEAAIPRIEPLAQHFLKGVDSLALTSNTGLITGIVNYNFEDQHAYNSLITLGVDDAAEVAKRFLSNSNSEAGVQTALEFDGIPNSFAELQEAPLPPQLEPPQLESPLFETLQSEASQPEEPLSQQSHSQQSHSQQPHTQQSKQPAQYHYQHNNRYAKHHLLPIGEFIPLEKWIRGLAPLFDLPMSSFSRGDYEQTNLQVNGARFVPAICFEIAFPQQIRANLRQHSNFIITVSNDAWFGDSHGPHQHLEIAQMRAIEYGIPVLRATNNGITAFINSDGSIAAQAPQFKEATIKHTVYTNQGITPYRYLGEFPHWFIVSIISLLAFKQKRRQR